jgi:addiction module HigA family antidote
MNRKTNDHFSAEETKRRFEAAFRGARIAETAFARAVGVSPRRINEIVLGKRAATAGTDLRMARYFGLSEGFFLRLQTDHDLLARLRQIGDKLKAIKPRAT